MDLYKYFGIRIVQIGRKLSKDGDTLPIPHDCKCMATGHWPPSMFITEKIDNRWMCDGPRPLQECNNASKHAQPRGVHLDYAERRVEKSVASARHVRLPQTEEINT